MSEQYHISDNDKTLISDICYIYNIEDIMIKQLRVKTTK